MSRTEEVLEKKPTKGKSVSYALKAIITHLETLKSGKIISQEDFKTTNDIVRKAAEKYVKETYGIG